jgi:hypothetical protein
MRKPELARMGLVAELVGQNIGQLLVPIVFGQLVYQIGWVYAGYMMIPLCLVGFISGWSESARVIMSWNTLSGG